MIPQSMDGPSDSQVTVGRRIVGIQLVLGVMTVGSQTDQFRVDAGRHGGERRVVRPARVVARPKRIAERRLGVVWVLSAVDMIRSRVCG
jgi:hypothetical protein